MLMTWIMDCLPRTVKLNAVEYHQAAKVEGMVQLILLNRC